MVVVFYVYSIPLGFCISFLSVKNEKEILTQYDLCIEF